MSASTQTSIAWVGDGRGEGRLQTLRVLCDTYVPAVRSPANAPDDPFWSRTASDRGVEYDVAAYIQDELDAEDREGLLKLLDLLTATGFRWLPRSAREAVVKGLRTSDQIAAGLDALRALTQLFFYGKPDEDSGLNPNWAMLGYPGPPDVEVDPDRERLPTLRPTGSEELQLTAEVVVVGSGAGGGVIAGELATAGLDVIVVDAGEHYEEEDFTGHELDAFRRMYWRGGYTPTEDGNVLLIAGRTLGGGTTVNWTNCVLPPGWVRGEWADEHGLEGLDTQEFDGHLEAVAHRISATDTCSDLNGPNQRLATGAEVLGLHWSRTRRNADPTCYDPASAGHMGFGDRSGSKQTTVKTYLRDAVDADARVLPRCEIRRISTERGRASGVEGTYTHPDGRRVPVTVRAPRVIVAGGALETPALLLRSGLGGPAVGRHLHLHPVTVLVGMYPEVQRSWWGPPQAAVIDEYADLTDGFGFLVESPHFGTGLAASALPWLSGRDHKVLISRSANLATFFAQPRDRGSGQVSIDAQGDAVVTYPFDDPLDRRHLVEGLEALARLHEAAGAQLLLDLSPKRPIWKRGEDLHDYTRALQDIPFGKGERTLFSAHQMGTARMGQDPADSVADPLGQLHDTLGVWIGDTSAFPTAIGSNPMFTCMALARRTAHAIIAEHART